MITPPKKYLLKNQNIEYSRNSEKRVDLKTLKIIKTQHIGSLELYYGELELNIDFYKFETDNGRKINFQKIDVPTLKFKTKGIWLNISDSIIKELERKYKDPDIIKYSISGVENMLLTVFPLKILCDRCDVNTFSTHYHLDTLKASIFIYDMYEGGVGLSKKCLDVFGDLTKIALNLVKKCVCKGDEGCALCIYGSSCSINTKKRHKGGTILISRKLLEEMQEEEILEIDNANDEELVTFEEDIYAEIEQEVFKDISSNLDRKTIQNYDKSKNIHNIALNRHVNNKNDIKASKTPKIEKIIDIISSEKYKVLDDFSLPKFVTENPYVLKRLNEIPCPKCGLNGLSTSSNKIKCKKCGLVLN